jgi:hypothetical protein
MLRPIGVALLVQAAVAIALSAFFLISVPYGKLNSETALAEVASRADRGRMSAKDLESFEFVLNQLRMNYSSVTRIQADNRRVGMYGFATFGVINIVLGVIILRATRRVDPNAS